MCVRMWPTPMRTLICKNNIFRSRWTRQKVTSTYRLGRGPDDSPQPPFILRNNENAIPFSKWMKLQAWWSRRWNHTKPLTHLQLICLFQLAWMNSLTVIVDPSYCSSCAGRCSLVWNCVSISTCTVAVLLSRCIVSLR